MLRTRTPQSSFSFAANFPDPYANMSADERDTRALIGSDQCVIDQEQFYVRGCLEIPILETKEVFLWGLWAMVWEKDYDEISRHWEFIGREKKIGPYKGRLTNSLSIYPGTFNLPVTIHIRPVVERPLFIVDELNNLMGID
jgi:hypothetical protein